MVATKDVGHRKREYILVKHGLKYYYARVSRDDPDIYHVMVNVGEKEGRQIIERANESSDYNSMIDEHYATFAPEKKGKASGKARKE